MNHLNPRFHAFPSGACVPPEGEAARASRRTKKIVRYDYVGSRSREKRKPGRISEQGRRDRPHFEHLWQTGIRCGFSFLKIRYTITPTGRIVRRICRGGTKRMRKRMKAYRRKLDEENITLENIEMSLEAFLANCNRADSHRTKLSFWKRFRKMFPESRAFWKARARRVLPEAIAFKAQWERENHGKRRQNMLAAWKDYQKGQVRNNDVLQVSFRRKNR